VYFTPIAKLECDGSHHQPHVLGHRVCLRRHQFVHAYCVIRYGYKKGKRAQYEPENKKLEWWLTGFDQRWASPRCWLPACFVMGEFRRGGRKDAGVFEAWQQWHWGFRFPGKEGADGHGRRKYVSDKNRSGA